MVIVIPKPNAWAREAMLVTKRADTRGAEQKMSASTSGSERQPPRRKHADEVSA